jgi:hypothetical protein
MQTEHRLQFRELAGGVVFRRPGDEGSVRRQVLALEAALRRPLLKYLDHLPQLLRAALHHFI